MVNMIFKSFIQIFLLEIYAVVLLFLLMLFFKELGYRGDVGYQTFLYSSEADIRKIFMFLVDKLPKETVETTEETLGK